MKIETLSLKNIKAFEELELAIGALTMLTGLNGSGKSSVIQALAILRQSNDMGILSNGEIALNGNLVEIGTGRDLLYQIFSDSIVGVSLKSADGQTLNWTAPVAPGADVLTCAGPTAGDRLREMNLFTRGFQFLRADRITPAVTFPRSQHLVANERSLGPRGEYTAHFLQHFGKEIEVSPKLRRADEKAPYLEDQVNSWMQAFSPGVRVEAHSVPMTDYVRLAYSFKGREAAYSDPLRPTNVGFGLTHALPIVTACLAALPGSLIVIENPEAQLHPRGQAAMGLLLALTASNDVQVIVETHSDHVLNGVRIAAKQNRIDPTAVRLHYFAREPGASAHHVSPELDSHGRLSFWPEGFFDQWEESLDALLD